MSTATDDLIALLPYARRYARALAGTQPEGDALVALALASRQAVLPMRLGLYAAISQHAAGRVPVGTLTMRQRQLLLLTSLEELSLEATARVLDMDLAAAQAELATARALLRTAAVTDVLIIEDEPVIAMDLSMLVQGCGHRVVGVAASEAEAVRLMQAQPAGLVLADVNLGRGGNGIVAVRRILESLPVPVIFVTAYPEQLLMAEGVGPALVIRKPFDPVALAIATYQAIAAGRVPIG